MRQEVSQARKPSRQAGMTLLELIIACTILMIMASAAMPVARYTVKRQKEAELHRDLREMRDAIDRYKDAADKNLIRVEAGTEGYPPDLDTLVKGVDMISQTTGIPGATTPGQPIVPSTGLSGGTSGFGGATSGFGGATSGLSGGTSGLGGATGGFGGSFGQTQGQTNGLNGASQGQDLIRHVRFLRRIPVDPVTGKAEWGMRSVQDDPDSTSWGGKDVFDVFSLSTSTTLDGTKYSDW
jgi:type II secretory pathway pseudopilin PulG